MSTILSPSVPCQREADPAEKGVVPCSFHQLQDRVDCGDSGTKSGSSHREMGHHESSAQNREAGIYGSSVVYGVSTTISLRRVKTSCSPERERVLQMKARVSSAAEIFLNLYFNNFPTELVGELMKSPPPHSFPTSHSTPHPPTEVHASQSPPTSV